MSEGEHSDTSPRDDTDAVRDIARDLAEVGHPDGHPQGEATAYLSDPPYTALRLRLENAHAAVEAAMVEVRMRSRARLNEGR